LKTPGWLATILVLAGGAFFSYQWWISGERAVKNRLAEVARTLSVPAGDTDVARLARLARLRGYLADDIRIRTGNVSETIPRDALLAFASRWTPLPGPMPGGASGGAPGIPPGINVELVDVHVTLTDQGTGAQVYLTAKFSGYDVRTGESTLDAREGTVTMSNQRGEWLISGVETTETLQR
jgi:hypothetical protein